jgi:hypothetical protein
VGIPHDGGSGRLLEAALLGRVTVVTPGPTLISVRGA